MSDETGKWKLPDGENRRIFEEVIAPRALEGVIRPEQPRIVFIGGQAASSKTTGQRTALERLGEESGVIADFDALLTDHPDYAGLLARDDRTASQLAGGDAYVWMRDLIQLAKEERLNIIREGHMGGGSTEREAVEFRGLGYATEADVMAVPAAISRTANLHRYQEMREMSLHGRLVATEIHDKAYQGIPRTLQGVDERKFLDAVRLHRWGGGVVHENALGADGEWRAPAQAREALERERTRPLDREQAAWLQERFDHLSRALPADLRPQLQEIRALARQVGVTDLGQGSSVSVAAAAGLHRRTAARAEGGPAQGGAAQGSRAQGGPAQSGPAQGARTQGGPAQGGRTQGGPGSRVPPPAAPGTGRQLPPQQGRPSGPQGGPGGGPGR
ncbi:zeta toxin family protein [Streptomyces sp. MNU89]|uniref:zeta toxin family protein n=1 Tax=Streptomyces sp. MNU89 TaxID=2560025 RepID=UPI001E5A6BC1|nr:zeta toxin family protein [Streptomyces sp. MNU89]MCC9740165.1 zeta toxin family protein [Streptomyces sp. MNU89]